MKIVFFGTSDFSVPSLSALLKTSHKVVAVVTQPDRERGRHLVIEPSPVKAFALENNIFVYQPEHLVTPQTYDTLKGFDADLFVVIAYGNILPAKILEIPKKFSINLHSSVLPKYRGAAPMNWAIVNGEKTSGVSIIKMTEQMDAGDIILKKEIPLQEDETSVTLSEKLSKLGSELLLEAIESIDKGDYKLEKQQGEVTFAPKLKKEDGLIDWQKSALQIHNQVRGLLPWPGTYSYYQSKLFKILETKVIGGVTNDLKPGQVAQIEKDGILIKTGKEHLLILSCQLAGGKVMDATSFITGHRVKIEDQLGTPDFA